VATTALVETSTQEFAERYSALLLSAWRDETVMAAVLDDPARAAVEAGLPVEPGATVRVDLSQPEMFFTLDEVLREWTATPGEHVLHLPPDPMIDMSELADAEVDEIAAWCLLIFIV
jgi:hypothetical protein